MNFCHLEMFVNNTGLPLIENSWI